LFPVSRRGGNIPVETMSEPDHRLIAEFNARRSEEAFAALVRQHVNLVFATALRQVGDAGAAEEITQNVFVALAQAAGKLGSHPTIAGWLHQTALNKSREWLRSELRRRKREQVAVNLELARTEGDSVWASLVPLLDEALLELHEPDRLAVILHFMEGQTFHEVGSALGIGEDTARKRVNRCLEQLAHFFRRRGFAAPALVAGAPLFTLSSHVAPAGLAASATTAGLAAAHSAATSTLTLIKGALKIMAWTKMKTAIVITAVALAGAGTATVTVKMVSHHREESIWNNITGPGFVQQLKGAPPAVSIRPTRFTREAAGAHETRGKILGTYQPFESLLARAYDTSRCRILALTPLPPGDFDFITSVPQRPREALQKMIKQKFGITGRRETRETDVLLLTVKRHNAPGLKPTSSKAGNSTSNEGVGHLNRTDGPIGFLIYDFESYLHVPVIDRTGLTGRFDVDIAWDDEMKWDDSTGRFYFTNPDGLKQAVLDQLGLELVPSQEPIEFLVVERAKN
jgi:uncharacterized protein (TIGR03435 family)